jgi:hypothetical protein
MRMTGWLSGVVGSRRWKTSPTSAPKLAIFPRNIVSDSARTKFSTFTSAANAAVGMQSASVNNRGLIFISWISVNRLNGRELPAAVEDFGAGTAHA